MELNATTMVAMIFNWSILVLLVTGIIVFIFWLVKRTGSSKPREGAMDIAKESYAKGEISREEFEQIKKDLF